MSININLIFGKKTMSKPNIRKRTLQEIGRAFNEEWELQFYVVAVKDKMMCLLRNSMITTVKRYNANY